jgi:hypothetical protein
MKSLYIKAIKRKRLERFAGYFFRGACVFGLCAAIFAAGYTMGNNRGRVAGMLNAAAEIADYENRGGNGYFIDAGGVHCLYE